jgi:hypothetical protein
MRISGRSWEKYAWMVVLPNDAAYNHCFGA